MRGLDPRIHLLKKRWIAGSSPAMTRKGCADCRDLLAPDLLRGLGLRLLLCPIVRLRLGPPQRLLGFEARRHRAVLARQNLVMLDVERAEPPLLPHRQRDEVANLDELGLAEML